MPERNGLLALLSAPNRVVNPVEVKAIDLEAKRRNMPRKKRKKAPAVTSRKRDETTVSTRSEVRQESRQTHVQRLIEVRPDGARQIREIEHSATISQARVQEYVQSVQHSMQLLTSGEDDTLLTNSAVGRGHLSLLMTQVHSFKNSHNNWANEWWDLMPIARDVFATCPMVLYPWKLILAAKVRLSQEELSDIVINKAIWAVFRRSSLHTDQISEMERNAITEAGVHTTVQAINQVDDRITATAVITLQDPQRTLQVPLIGIDVFMLKLINGGTREQEVTLLARMTAEADLNAYGEQSRLLL